MLNITIVCVGKLKERFYEDAAKEYEKRLGGYCRLRITELPEERLPPSPGPALIQNALAREAQAIEKAVPAGSAVVAMCVEGETPDSPAFSRKLAQLALSGQSRLCFVIGGSYGLHDRVKEKSLLRLSMSRMTFPHHLARIMLLEQLYRAFKLQEGGTYHK